MRAAISVHPIIIMLVSINSLAWALPIPENIWASKKIENAVHQAMIQDEKENPGSYLSIMELGKNRLDVFALYPFHHALVRETLNGIDYDTLRIYLNSFLEVSNQRVSSKTSLALKSYMHDRLCIHRRDRSDRRNRMTQ